MNHDECKPFAITSIAGTIRPAIFGAMWNDLVALGDQWCLAIISKLQDVDDPSVTTLCEGMVVPRQAVSKHLGVLTDARLVSVEKFGRERRYCLEPDRLEEANYYLAQVGAKWDRALQRLKNHLE